MIKVLILCTGNSCRSQLAEAYLRHFAKAEVLICSAGTDPKGIHPMTLAVLEEDGTDASGLTSEHVDRYSSAFFDYIITVCDDALENCPVFPGDGLRFHYSFADPARVEGSADERLQAFRDVQYEIRNFARGFAKVYLQPERKWEDKVVEF